MGFPGEEKLLSILGELLARKLQEGEGGGSRRPVGKTPDNAPWPYPNQSSSLFIQMPDGDRLSAKNLVVWLCGCAPDECFFRPPRKQKWAKCGRANSPDDRRDQDQGRRGSQGQFVAACSMNFCYVPDGSLATIEHGGLGPLSPPAAHWHRSRV